MDTAEIHESRCYDLDNYMAVLKLLLALGVIFLIGGIGISLEGLQQKSKNLSHVAGTQTASVTHETVPENMIIAQSDQSSIAIDVPVRPALLDSKEVNTVSNAAESVESGGITEEPVTTLPSTETPAQLVRSLSVARGEQPAPSLALSGAGGVPFTHFVLTAGDTDVQVTSVTIERTGPGANGAFAWVSLTDEEDSDLGGGTLDSNRRIKTREPFTVLAHQSKKLIVTADMEADLSAYEGQMPTLSVVSIEADAPVTGLPVAGVAHSINSTLTIGSASALRGNNDPGSDIIRYIGEKDIKFAGIRITASSQEDLTLDSIAWRQNGTASVSDAANIMTVVDGVPFQTEVDERYYTSTFSPGIVIPKGQSVDVYVKGDLLISGAQRTVKFDINESGDVSLTGNTYGYGVGIAAEGNTSDTGNSVFITSDGTTDGDEGIPFYSAPLVTVSGAAVTSIGNATP